MQTSGINGAPPILVDAQVEADGSALVQF